MRGSSWTSCCGPITVVGLAGIAPCPLTNGRQLLTATLTSRAQPKTAVDTGAIGTKRTMQTQVTFARRGLDMAIFSNVDIVFNNALNVQPETANVYTNGEFTCQGSQMSPMVFYGNVIAQKNANNEGVTMENACEVKGSVYTAGKFYMNDLGKVGGDVQVDHTNMQVGTGNTAATVGGNAYWLGTDTTNMWTSAFRGASYAPMPLSRRFPQTRGPGLQATLVDGRLSLPTIEADAVSLDGWRNAGWTVKSIGPGACDETPNGYSTLFREIRAMATRTVFLCPGGTASRGTFAPAQNLNSNVLEMTHDVAVFACKIYSSGFFQFRKSSTVPTATRLQLHLINPTSCGSNATVNFHEAVTFDPSIDVFVYSPGNVGINAGTYSGQIYGQKVVSHSSTMTMTYRPIAPPLAAISNLGTPGKYGLSTSARREVAG